MNSKLKKYWQGLGPGLVTGAADDDPSGIATYSQTGARYGTGLLWLAAWTFPLMAVVLEMCARIGLVTGRGLAGSIRIHYPRAILYLVTVALFAANTFNIGADLGAMAKATQLIFPHLNFTALIIGFTLISLLLQIYLPYKKYAHYLKWLAFILLAYIFSAIATKPHWVELIRDGLIPNFHLTRDGIILVTAILGTTISPYLFFWQTSQEVEEEIAIGKTNLQLRENATREEIHEMRTDVWSGMFVSNLIMFFIIAAAGATLFQNGLTEIQTAAQAAEALRPLAGEAAYLLFTFGVIGTGLLAVPVLAGSAAYAVAETFGWREGLYRKFGQAHAFYAIIILAMALGLISNFFGLDPIKSLIYAAVLNGLVAPLVLFLIVRLSGNKKIMKQWANRPLAKFFGWVVIALMTTAAIATVISLFR